MIDIKNKWASLPPAKQRILAVSCIVVGGSTVLIWKNFFAFTGVYEIIPGFILSCLAIVIVSLMDSEPEPEVVARYDEAVAKLKGE